MRRLLLVLLAFVVSTAFAGRRTIDLSGSGWTCDGDPVTVPHTWNAVDACDGPGETYMPRNGDSAASTNSYLRTSKTYARLLPRSKAGRRYFLRFEGASIKTTVRIDGRPVGSHLGAFTAFAFEVTDFLKADREVRLEVDVDNRLDETTQPLSADFSVYGGLYRRVSLVETPPVCIDPMTDGADGVSLEVNTNGTVVAMIRVLGAASETQTFRIPHPKLWSPETPNLYTQRVVIASGDAVQVRFAFRTFEFRDDGFYLNGVRRQLKGVNRHQDRRGKGWAVSPADEDEDIRLMKEMGADALRTAHYPQSQHIYDLCDELGLICWVEYPNVNRLVFSETFERNVRRQVREMILQLRRHPSIAMWGLWNELEMVGRGWNLDQERTRDFLSRLRDFVRALDPSRPTVAATDRPQARRVNDVTDQLAYNRYPVWYSQETMREMLDVMLAADDRKIVGMSEYGVGGSIRQHGDPSVAVPPAGPWHPEEYQAWRMHDNLRELQRESRIWGHFVWAMFDFGADRRTEGDAHGVNDKGLVTADRRTKKDVYYLYQANWRPDVPTLHLVGSRMRETDAASVSVLAFSNVGDVMLTVNGERLGIHRPDDACGAVWHDVALGEGDNEIVVEAGGQRCCAVWRRVMRMQPRSRCVEAVPEIVRKAGELTADSDCSHFRALALAAEGCGIITKDRRKLAKALHRLLALPGVGGHSRRSSEPVLGSDEAAAGVERNLVLRELALAKALYALGDHDDLGLRTLEAYRRDYRKAYANYVEPILPPPAPELGFHGVCDERARMFSRGGFSAPPVGWMTWYALRFKTDEAAVLRNAKAFMERFGDVLAEKPILWVDWEWCHARFKPKDADEGEDVLTPRASVYPRGLGPLAADLKKMGFVPGLWVSCISDVRTNALFAAHPEWMLPRHDTWCGGVWGDPTAPGFCESYVPRLFATYRRWGYEAFKWDTLPHALLTLEELRDAWSVRGGVPKDVLRQMVKAGRAAVGGAYLLSCSGETDDAVEACPDLFDAARIGADVWQWEDFMREGVDRFLKYASLHTKTLWCDMDNLVLREPFSNLAQARTRLTLSYLFGVPMTLGDEIADLDEARVEMLRKVLPTFNVRPVSVGRRVPGRVFRTRVDVVRPEGEWTFHAFTNFETNRTLQATFDCPKGTVTDFWKGCPFTCTGGRMTISVPPGDSVLLKVVTQQD